MNNIALLLIRIVFAGSMLYGHGLSKLYRLIDGTAWDFIFGFIPYPSFNISWTNPIFIGDVPTLILAVFSEFLAPLFILIGYKTKIFSFFPAATMFVAAFIVHLSDPFARKEKAILFLIGFIVIMMMGPGKYSIDRKFS
jgi:putative oxidoreductase